MSELPDLPIPPPEKLHAPVARLLRPLVRLFIRCGISFPALCDLLRELYVNVAEYDFVLPGKDQTDSRVSLLTGIHRKEVRRLRGAGAPVGAVPASLSHTSRIFARWLAAPEFTDARGHPLPLPRISAQDEAPSFEKLVMSITKDVRPRAVLDEWLDRKLVTINADGYICLAEAAFIPSGGSDQQLYYFGRNLHDHVAAAVANILGEDPKFLERAVHYDGLSMSLAQHLETRSKELASEVLQAANREAHNSLKADSGGDWRWIFGVYTYREQTESDTPVANSDDSLTQDEKQ